jgi:hypothetical protein
MLMSTVLEDLCDAIPGAAPEPELILLASSPILQRGCNLNAESPRSEHIGQCLLSMEVAETMQVRERAEKIQK